MFAVVVREGMLVRLPSGRIARVLWSTKGDPGFYEVEYVDNGQKADVHCRLMRYATTPRDPAAGDVIPLRSSLDPDGAQRIDE